MILSDTKESANFCLHWYRSRSRRVHPNASSYCSMEISTSYRSQEHAKKSEYGQRVQEIEHGVLTPIVLSTTGGMGREAKTFSQWLADMIALEEQKPYSSVMGWLRSRLSFAILRAVIMCIRDSQSSLHRPICSSVIPPASSEGRIPPD